MHELDGARVQQDFRQAASAEPQVESPRKDSRKRLLRRIKENFDGLVPPQQLADHRRSSYDATTPETAEQCNRNQCYDESQRSCRVAAAQLRSGTLQKTAGEREDEESP